MIIINPDEVFNHLMIDSNDKKKEMLNASYETLLDSFAENPILIIKYLVNNQISEIDFFNSVNYMINFYEKYEDYIKCGKLHEMIEYVQEQYAEIDVKLNEVKKKLVLCQQFSKLGPQMEFS